ncbi:DNA-directed RNA polymerase III subunit RPC9 [Aphelenchoides besseyi]|nr:DNA-directed RNA polymerase III subunit RPC9 [Aphelenchoides besseyi]KAI6228543.1 DNA-directed RNA polymerase III subunit RPC9 [Aphelenchoides besseyi]
MEVTNPRCTFLTNQEVLSILQEANKASRPQSKSLQQHKTVLYEGIKYLNSTPAVNQTELLVKSLMKALAKFHLTSAELLQIANLRPKNLVDIEMIIEECDERYDEQQTTEMLELIRRHLLQGESKPVVQGADGKAE